MVSKIRTFGWVQNPGKFENLKRVVQVFDRNSKVHNEVKNIKIPTLVKESKIQKELVAIMNQHDLIYTYKELVGTGTSIRSEAPCDAIIQATIADQGNKKGYIDNWSSDGFLRWAHALGFIEYINKSDSFVITDVGLAYSKSADGSAIEKEILIEAISSYPPAIRILTLLEDGQHLTKFDLGKNLGFSGESGFTSLPEGILLDTLANAMPKDKGEIRNNWEGSSDKYARMIGGWLDKLGLVKQGKKEFIIPTLGKPDNKEFISHAFKITGEGLKVLRRAKGSTKFTRVPKRVYWEMLATNLTDKEYVRTRRALILEILIKAGSLKIEQIQDNLKKLGFDEVIETIENDIKGLINTGIFIEIKGRFYQLKDHILQFVIPNRGVTKQLVKSELEEKKSELRHKLKYVPHEYIELIEIARNSTQDRILEMKVMEFFMKVYGYRGKHLGGSRKPDGAIYTVGSPIDYGVIVDTKAYSGGYNLPIGQADEMQRYVEENQTRNKHINPNEWWKVYPSSVTEFKFLFVSGHFKGNYKAQLTRLNHITNCNGAVLSVEELLIGGEMIKAGTLTLEEVRRKFNNGEINF
ncbi:restriction endonuclease FokI C-terminal domain-containing protein [Planomicrobium okeanokoites]|uniref:Type II restriction enzyme FokI n=3 Tax=Planomicrobium okeanokoites TaxID=244 RepID=T2F1_PLAOK|nr:restriction endonuclease FokI C-terminal domain-containing protein [Planomicrobium okeanokoites]P14870.2 RecName: Full=Type II restriction enzyme FokI; Short=R.FokI; AltName: Full=Endonuclease FokI; AltName: Full=Type-2 restriction enzyme FokI [Planomicrobium okeanokoites]AAA24934.1 endonuclease [Planomicrobium okeanokoites]